MARAKVEAFKDFTNVEEVFDKMLELGFFVNEAHKQDHLDELINPKPGPFSNHEYWYSNGVVEVKIFRRMFGAFEIWNYRRILHKDVTELFAVATIPVISSATA